MTPPMRYLEIAADLRRRLDEGEFPVGSVIPGGYVGLRDEYRTTQAVLREALAILEVEGRVRPVRGTGLVVLDRQAPERIDRGRLVYRDGLGYYFTRVASTWRPVAMPTREWTPAPLDVAEVLGVGAQDEVLVRRRVLGPDPATPSQIVTSYVAPDLARGTILEQAHTGPGGILDRLEQDMGHGPLTWEEDISARMPERDEARDLKISRNVPVLILTRTARSATVDRVVTVDTTVMSAARFKVGYEITRDESAQWPTPPADSENPPPTGAA